MKNAKRGLLFLCLSLVANAEVAIRCPTLHLFESSVWTVREQKEDWLFRYSAKQGGLHYPDVTDLMEQFKVLREGEMVTELEVAFPKKDARFHKIDGNLVTLNVAKTPLIVRLSDRKDKIREHLLDLHWATTEIQHVTRVSALGEQQYYTGKLELYAVDGPYTTVIQRTLGCKSKAR